MHEAHGLIPVRELIYSFINFSVFAGLLIYFLKKPLADFFAARKDRFLAVKKEAEDLFAAADGEYRELKGKLTGFDAEADEFRINTKAQSARYAEKIIEEAGVSAERIKRESAELIESERDTHIKAIKIHLIQKVFKQAGTELGQEMTAVKRESYLSSYSHRVGG
jgi:F-type H+-transporting ATPase subunit b